MKPTEKGYEIGLLWKNDKVEFPNTFQTALNRFLQLEKRLEKDPLSFYEYLEKRYLKKLSPKEYTIETQKPSTYLILL